jgi:hypothetical protein
MTSTIKVNNIQNQCGANIINENSNTITIGASGDTIALASGASQSGFGREGSVDWQTSSIKTAATFTPASGEGYFVDTSSNAVTANLPAGAAGAIVAFSDYARNFATNKLTITPNGSEKIGGVNGSVDLQVNGQALTLVYVDGTKCWINVQNAEDTEQAASFVAATGGTVTTVDTNFKVHTFTGPGTFCVSAGSGPLGVVDYLVVAGGGAGGKGNNPEGGGGGGAGGYRESHVTATSGPYSASPLVSGTSIPISVQGYPIVVGGGGTTPAPSGCVPNRNGSDSSGLGITSAGGGRGAQSGCAPGATGGPGGSGGGGGAGTSSAPAGSGNDPATSPPQGNPGGAGGGGPGGPQGKYTGAGGGGATEAGVNASGRCGGRGGTGTSTSITGASVAYAGGGGSGGAYPTNACFGNQGAGSPCGTGGAGGCRAQGTAGTINRGGGGGGAGNTELGGVGGSGIVVIRYKFQ